MMRSRNDDRAMGMNAKNPRFRYEMNLRLGLDRITMESHQFCLELDWALRNARRPHRMRCDRGELPKRKLVGHMRVSGLRFMRGDGIAPRCARELFHLRPECRRRKVQDTLLLALEIFRSLP